LVATADLREGGEVVLMHGDEEAFGVEAMHLDQPVAVVSRPVDDDEDEVVVTLELCPLIGVLGVLDGKRMKLEDLAQDLEIARIRLIEVEPEETTAESNPSTVSRVNSTSALPPC
jgi:hypothetical protein